MGIFSAALLADSECTPIPPAKWTGLGQVCGNAHLRPALSQLHELYHPVLPSICQVQTSKWKDKRNKELWNKKQSHFRQSIPVVHTFWHMAINKSQSQMVFCFWPHLMKFIS